MLKRSFLMRYASLFFLSGVAGLVYEIIWERLLEVYFGVTLTAITLIVAAYMGGLGLGSIIGGRYARKAKDPVLLYGVLEIGIGLFGLASPELITWIGQKTAGSSYMIVFLLCFGLLLIPTLLMGMTLPLLTQAFVNQVDTAGERIGLLYGINTLGAAVGALLAGYGLIGWFGYRGALIVSTCINILVGTGAIGFRKKPIEAKVEGKKEAVTELTSTLEDAPKYTLLLAAAFLVGFIDMGFEILWLRVLGILNKSTAYAFPTILFVFLTGLALGGLYWGRRADKSQDKVRLFWKLQIGVGIITGLSFLAMWGGLNIPLLEPWFRNWLLQFQQPIQPVQLIDHQATFLWKLFLTGLLGYFLHIYILVFPASLLMGGGLPILDRIAIRRAEQSGRRVGEIHLANILGSVAGTLVTSFILLHFMGSELTLKLLIFLCLGFTGLYFGIKAIPKWKELIVFPGVVITILVLLPWRGQLYTKLYSLAMEGKVVVEETRDTILALNYNNESEKPSWLWISGVLNGYFPTDGNYERSVLTCSAASHPARILVIGMGGGNSAYFLTQLPDVEKVVIVELVEGLGTFLDRYVPVAQRTLGNPLVEYINDDGRRYLYSNPDEQFDLIFIDPMYNYMAGHNNLYSLEAMQLYQDHLSEKGVFCGWIDEEHILPKTVASVFPHVYHLPKLLVAGNEPFSLDRDYMEKVYKNYLLNGDEIIGPDTHENLDPNAVLSGVMRNDEDILFQEQQTPIITDMNPWLEYYYLHVPVTSRGHE